ncbi:hypothetical protein LNTAR_19602 [Lentisphaera araneosa HTCC2155]|uniref:ThuA-like domain-containing protein n=1 Tax=Lentisphaera araneosa HTCC2155 TaxID=313628 RepID=A6DQY6_9BACT|nr:ThuA domain-containing protein [Lentisphaera araneosa]EDM26036.1 hypothetical protein LNTAR_19602 [Lentisphaera araneosa HTCC2155]
MIYFFADNHYQAHPGLSLYKQIVDDDKIKFYEDDWSAMESFADDCDLLILNLIGGTCDIAHPNKNAEAEIKKYLQSGKPMLLLHGSSAAFSEWSWWRKIVGYRWVRPNDPEGIEASFHPVRPYKLLKTDSRHPLMTQLKEVEISHEDEIYMGLQEVCPTEVLMTISTDEGTAPQVLTHKSPWDGIIHTFIPGHRKETLEHPNIFRNIKVLIEDLIKTSKQISTPR